MVRRKICITTLVHCSVYLPNLVDLEGKNYILFVTMFFKITPKYMIR